MAATQALPNLVEKIAFANYLPLFSRATSDSAEPTPGYTLIEIEKLSFDYPHHCKQIINFLCRRLEKPSHQIKIKVLKIMEHLVFNGHVNLRAALRKNDSAVKAATMCSGAADPLTGMVVYEQIRKMAKDLLDNLYSTERIQRDEELLLQNKDLRPTKPFLGAMGSSTTGDSKYQGFGNSPNAKEETVVEKVWSYFDKFSTPSDHASKIIKEAVASSVGSYEAVRIPQQFVQFQHTESLRPMPLLPMPSNVSVKPHVPGKAGGGWEDSDDDADHEPHLALSEQKSLASIELLDDSGSKENCEERDLIKNYTDKGEFPVLWQEISDVCSECLKLSIADVLHSLSEELSNANEVKGMRILVLLEALLQTEIFSSTRSVQEASTIITPSIERISNGIELSEKYVIKAQKLSCILSARSG